MNKDYDPFILLLIIILALFAVLLIGIGIVMSHYLIYLLDTALPVLGL